MTITGTPPNATAEYVKGLEAQFVLQVYKRAPVVFTHGRGVHLYDTDGRAYLDFISGIGVTALGHAHPLLTRAIQAQAEELLHTSNIFFHPLQGEVARRLAALTGLQRTFVTNSGTEANEACLKFARRYWKAQGAQSRTRFVAFEHGFAGRTFGSLSVTADEHYRTPFEPLVPGVTFVDPADPQALVDSVTNETAAIIVEPIQGEGGIRPISADLVAAIATARARTGTLLIADEIQCGMGRTGVPFHSTTLGLAPDLMSIGKALGSGVPVGAAVMSQRVADAIAFGDHGSTYGGNLLACRAALVVLDELERGLLPHVATVGRHMEARLQELGRRHGSIREVRGLGLMWGLELDRDAAPVVVALREGGLLANATAKTVVRLLPPLVVEAAHVDEAVGRIDAVLGRVGSGQ
ncbi:MAG: acetylornithine/succinylornithine family transaminase [Vicinamibacterales bacterium]